MKRYAEYWGYDPCCSDSGSIGILVRHHCIRPEEGIILVALM